MDLDRLRCDYRVAPEGSGGGQSSTSELDIEGHATSCSFADGVLTVEVEVPPAEQPRETELAPADAALQRRVVEIKADELRLESVDSVEAGEEPGLVVVAGGGCALELQNLAQRCSTEVEYATLMEGMDRAATGQARPPPTDGGWVPVGAPCPIKSIILQLPNESRPMLGEAAEKLRDNTAAGDMAVLEDLLESTLAGTYSGQY